MLGYSWLGRDYGAREKSIKCLFIGRWKCVDGWRAFKRRLDHRPDQERWRRWKGICIPISSPPQNIYPPSLTAQSQSLHTFSTFSPKASKGQGNPTRHQIPKDECRSNSTRILSFSHFFPLSTFSLPSNLKYVCIEQVRPAGSTTFTLMIIGDGDDYDIWMTVGRATVRSGGW